jgi:hypothetical protein
MAKYSYALVGMMTGPLLLGCNPERAKDDAIGASQPAEATTTDPLAEFQTLVQDLNREAFSLRRYGDENVPFALAPQSLQYDVRKTQSLVSPYAGDLYFEVELADSGYLDDYFAVRPTSSLTVAYGFQLTYVYQDERWVRRDSIKLRVKIHSLVPARTRWLEVANPRWYMGSNLDTALNAVLRE